MSITARNDAIAGFAAGAATGVPVSLTEYVKVRVQELHSMRRFAAHYASGRGMLTLAREMAAAMPKFCALFGGVCALEFSVNDRVRAHYGTTAGIVASSATGALLLSAADLKMLAKARPVGRERACTGFTPMLFRESFWMCGVTVAGPAAGRALQATGCVLGDDKTRCCFMGRLGAGVAMAGASQPFDVLARHLQLLLLAGDPAPTWAAALRSVGRSHPTGSILRGLYCGVAPRLVLASFGGAAAGHTYEHWFRPMLS